MVKSKKSVSSDVFSLFFFLLASRIVRKSQQCCSKLPLHVNPKMLSTSDVLLNVIYWSSVHFSSLKTPGGIPKSRLRHLAEYVYSAGSKHPKTRALCPCFAWNMKPKTAVLDGLQLTLS